MLLDEKEFETAFFKVSQTPLGAKLISHYISFCGCNDFGGISDDPRKDAFIKGKAYIGGDMLRTLRKVNLNRYVRMLQDEVREIKKQKILEERTDEDE